MATVWLASPLNVVLLPLHMLQPCPQLLDALSAADNVITVAIEVVSKTLLQVAPAVAVYRALP